MKRNEKKLFTLISRNKFEYRPDRLLTTGNRDAFQRLGATEFRSTAETKFGKMTRFWRYYVTAGMDFDWYRMNSTLTGLTEYNNRGTHEAFLSNLYAVPRIDYERKGWHASLRMTLKWAHYSTPGHHNYINASPRLYVKRQLTAKSEISGSVAYQLAAPQPSINIGVPILSDYRNLFISNNSDKYSHKTAATLSYRYRNPLKSLFFNLSATYNHLRTSIMSSQLFIGDFIVSTYADRLNTCNSWYISGGFSKGLGHSKMVTGCEVNASASSAASIRDNAAIPYRQIITAVKPYFKGSVSKWFYTSYQAAYSFSKLKINSEGNDCHTFRQDVSVTISPVDKVQLSIGAEHFLTRFSKNNTANLVLLDASAVWQLGSKIRLALTANNLLNRHAYRYVNYGTLSRSEHFFRIRGCNVLGSIQYRF